MLRVAAIQMVSGAQLESNLDNASRLVAEAAERGAELVVLPENFACFASKSLLDVASEEQQSGRLQAFLSALAARHRLCLVAGTIPILAGDGRVYASCGVYLETGELIGSYRKIHLFDAQLGGAAGSYRESDSYAPGDEPAVWSTSFGRLGAAVCYDIRFPELMRVMQACGLEVLAVPAAFTRKTGEAHWLALLRARAIENQCAVIGANQGGDHGGGRETSGQSVIIDCWGNTVAQAELGECCVVGNIDMQRQAQLRVDMPVLAHRRIPVG